MAICGSCGAVTPRLRVRLSERGESLPDQCPACAPQEFEGKFTAPSDKKIWMGYEAHPEEYEKQYDKDGVIFVRKLEYRHEQEELLRLGATDESEQQRRAESKKRAERRTEPMTPSEHLAAICKTREIADALALAVLAAEREAQRAESESWLVRPSGEA